jgi:GTPase SAR1 family protein
MEILNFPIDDDDEEEEETVHGARLLTSWTLDEGTPSDFVINCDSQNVAISYVITSRALCEICRRHSIAGQSGIFYEPNKVIEAEDMNRAMKHFLAWKLDPKTEGWTRLAKLVYHAKPHYEASIKIIQQQIAEGFISFSDLWYIFDDGMHVKTPCRGEYLGGIVNGPFYCDSWHGREFVIPISYLTMMGRKTINHKIGRYSGSIAIDSLSVTKITDGDRGALQRRGAAYAKYAKKPRFLHYENGSRYIETPFGVEIGPAHGRIMVDPLAYIQQMSGRNRESDGDHKLPEQDYWRCWPTLHAFDFTTHDWAEYSVSNMRPIQFRTDAFDKLVLDAKTKHLIRSLSASQSTGSASDIVDGKGGGVIFLLHGPPGVGKTSTAEAIAEETRRPLYSITMGELGTTAESLERGLSSALKLAARWNCHTLLDEADIFLEQRTENDIKRNAMVAVCLRLLEYHTGILFLTTNRVRSFDEAFMSRITIGLEYPEFSIEKRGQVWDSLLRMFGVQIAKDGVDALSIFKLNGRQIRNVIRTTMVVFPQDVTVETLNEVIQLTLKFKTN